MRKRQKKRLKRKLHNYFQSCLALLEECDRFFFRKFRLIKLKAGLLENEIGFGNVMMPLRLALVGEMKGPDVFEIAAILGKKEVISRIN